MVSCVIPAALTSSGRLVGFAYLVGFLAPVQKAEGTPTPYTCAVHAARVLFGAMTVQKAVCAAQAASCVAPAGHMAPAAGTSCREVEEAGRDARLQAKAAKAAKAARCSAARFEGFRRRRAVAAAQRRQHLAAGAEGDAYREVCGAALVF